jgi:hypothetical protein
MQSCTRQGSSDDVFKDVSIVIDMDSVSSDSLKLSYIRYIPLETSDQCLIGQANKILIRNNKIYVADFRKSMALFVFDMNGKLLFKIAKRGEGPGEYVNLHDFDIHRNGDIYLFDQNKKKFLVYNSEGEYLRDVNSEYRFSYFCLVNNRMYWSELRERGNMFVNLAACDMTNKKTEFILKDEKFLYDMGITYSYYNFYCSPDSITYYSPKFSEIIYSISENSVRPAIGIKNLNMPPKNIIEGWLQMKNGIERSKPMRNSKYFIESTYIYETDQYITIRCIRDVIDDFILYDKFSKKTSSSWMSYYFEKLGIDRIQGSTGKEFFGVVDFIPDNEHHKRILASREELKNWSEEDNPVIVLFNPDM